MNVSSGVAWQGQSGRAAYAASKAGLIGFTLPVARGLARYGVRVVTVAPGLFDTDMAACLRQDVRPDSNRWLCTRSGSANPTSSPTTPTTSPPTATSTTTVRSIAGGLCMA